LRQIQNWDYIRKEYESKKKKEEDELKKVE
jgi:hypothetical protein